MADDGKVFEMLWDCPNCDTKGLLGKTHRYCPACGAPQDPNRRYFPDESAKVEVVNHSFDGVDRTCPACDTPNGAKSEFCASCGSPLDAGKAVKLVADGESVKARKLVGDAPEAPPASSSSGRGCAIAVVATLVLLAIFCGVWTFWTTTSAATVTQASWSREVDVETYSEVSRSAWRDAVPGAAYDVSCRSKERSTEKIADGQECHTVRKDQGDGTFKEKQECTTKYKDKPIYDDWCDFKVHDWKVTDTQRAKGDDRDPAWPSVRVTGCQQLGCTREGQRRATYTLALQLEAGAESCDVDEAVWRQATPGSRWDVDVHVLGGSLDCGSLRPAP